MPRAKITQRPALTQERLRELFDYDSQTGIFTWKLWRGNQTRPGDRAGSYNNQGYRFLVADRKIVPEARAAWLYIYGKLPTHEIDHINGVRDDNRLCNLREATRAQNTSNTGTYKNNKLGVKGVRILNGRFQARIRSNHMVKCLGTFDTLEEAKAAYIDGAKLLHGVFARDG